jgi:hypothetical protein
MATRKKKITKPTATVEAATPPAPVITSIKGFDSDLSCRGFKFEIGKTYEVGGEIEACTNGFHACPTDEHPLSVFEFYPPAGARFAEVTQTGASYREGTKLASASITIGVELSLGDLAARAVKWVFDRAKWKDGPVATGANEGAAASGDRGAATATGYDGAATASGDSGAATASGDRGAATASGYNGAATASGDRGAATASGYNGAATASGDRGKATASGNRGAATASGNNGAATASGNNGAATATGYAGRVKGAEGCALFSVERDEKLNIVSVACGIVGRDGIKADTFYGAKDGKLVEATP